MLILLPVALLLVPLFIGTITQRFIIPEENRRDLREIPENVSAGLDIRPVRWMDEVLEIALTHMPEPWQEEAAVGPATESAEAVDDASAGRIRAH